MVVYVSPHPSPLECEQGEGMGSAVSLFISISPAGVLNTVVPQLIPIWLNQIVRDTRVAQMWTARGKGKLGLKYKLALFVTTSSVITLKRCLVVPWCVWEEVPLVCSPTCQHLRLTTQATWREQRSPDFPSYQRTCVHAFWPHLVERVTTLFIFGYGAFQGLLSAPLLVTSFLSF